MRPRMHSRNLYFVNKYWNAGQRFSSSQQSYIMCCNSRQACGGVGYSCVSGSDGPISYRRSKVCTCLCPIHTVDVVWSQSATVCASLEKSEQQNNNKVHIYSCRASARNMNYLAFVCHDVIDKLLPHWLQSWKCCRPLSPTQFGSHHRRHRTNSTVSSRPRRRRRRRRWENSHSNWAHLYCARTTTAHSRAN